MMQQRGNNSTSNTESIERLKHYKEIGFEVNAIEFGNELFYRNQRSPFVSDEADFLARAKSLSKDLKEIDNDLKISIPLIPRGSFTNPNWNQLIAADKSYFDAITVHKYIGVDVDNRLDLSNIGYEFGLAARLTLESAITFARQFAQDKPVWLTEWGVDVGESPTGNAASCLGMADCYIYMSENPDIFQRANWFCANGSANQMIKLVDGTFSTIEYPLKKTGYGFTYDIIRSVFENSTLLSSKVTTPTKLELIGSSVDAVSARVVVKDGKTLILALNLTDKPAELQLNMDGSIFSDGYKLEAVTFSDVADMPLIPFDENPFNFTQNGFGSIILPPLSVNKITLKGPVEYAVNFKSPANGAKFDEGAKLVVEANAGSAVSKLSLFVNDELVRSITNAPYIWGEDTITDAVLNKLETGFYQLKLVAENADTFSVSESITIEIQDTSLQSPFDSKISIPGKFEAEDYDNGEEGFAYHDSDGYNQAGEYRSDGVDIGTGGTGYVIAYSNNGEWLEYTVDVAETGLYDMHILYSSARPGGGAKIGASLPDENIVLLESFELPVTASWGSQEEITIASNISLIKGKHILRITVKERGFNFDWVEISKSNPVSTKERFTNKLNVYPNPNSKGIFNLNKRVKWKLYSLMGQKITSGEGNKVDVSQFQKGFYILKTEESIHKVLYE